MIDPLIKILKRVGGDDVQVLNFMDDLKASSANIEKVVQIHETVKKYTLSVGMVINRKKSAIQLSVEVQLPQSLQDIPRPDEVHTSTSGLR